MEAASRPGSLLQHEVHTLADQIREALFGAGDTTAEPQHVDVNGQRLVQVRDIELGDKQGRVRHTGFYTPTLLPL